MNPRTIGQTLSSLLGAAVLATLLAAPAAQAGIGAAPWTRSSKVTDTVADNGDGTWTYRYTVFNTSQQVFSPGGTRLPLLVDWELPWFGDAGIDVGSIVSPSRWAFSIETIGTPNANTGWDGTAAWQSPSDPLYAGPHSPYTGVTKVLHWYSLCWAQQNQLQVQGTSQLQAVAIGCETNTDDAITPDNSLGGFGFDADYGPTSAPYQASWAFLPVRTGDPDFPLAGIPNSPGTRDGGNVDEPATLSLLILGALGAYRLRRMHQRKSSS